MKLHKKLSITLIAGIAFILPMSVFAEDQNKDQKKQGKKEGGNQRGGKSSQQGTAGVATQSRGGEVRNPASGNNSAVGQNHGNRVSGGNATIQQTKAPAAITQRTTANDSQQTQVYSKKQRNQSVVNATEKTNQTRVNSVQQRSVQRRTQVQVNSNKQYNRNNNYGGLWYPANTHRNWNQNQHYYWNNHNYQWYNGGWLIIDAGYNPYYSNSVYGSSYGYQGSVASNVQSRLADQGYYQGPIDGDVGPGTRNAIANYQGDHGLRVTGRINDSLLQSLQL